MDYYHELTRQFIEDRARRARDNQEQVLALKEKLRSLLAQERGIEEIEIEYDGSWDNGWVNSVAYTGPDGGRVTPAGHEISRVFEDLVFCLIDQFHEGWEVDAGSHGTVVIDAKTLTGVIRHSRRIEEENGWSF